MNWGVGWLGGGGVSPVAFGLCFMDLLISFDDEGKLKSSVV